eukprot:2730061-Amphidinium_carterae.1
MDAQTSKNNQKAPFIEHHICKVLKFPNSKLQELGCGGFGICFVLGYLGIGASDKTELAKAQESVSQILTI